MCRAGQASSYVIAVRLRMLVGTVPDSMPSDTFKYLANESSNSVFVASRCPHVQYMCKYIQICTNQYHTGGSEARQTLRMTR